MLRSYVRRYPFGVRLAMALGATALLVSPLVAQTTATLIEWDVFQAVGARNVLSVQVDTTGATGVSGSVWVTTHNLMPRLGRLDPANDHYTEWKPIGASPETSGTPSGMALNPVNGDVWFTNTGRPMLLLKHADPALNDYFRKYTLGTISSPTLVDSHSVGVLMSDASAIVTAPTGINQIRGIYRVPRGPAGPIAAPTQQTNAVKYWRMDSPEQPRHMAVDAGGFIWFVNRKQPDPLIPAPGVLTRLDPAITSAGVNNQNFIEWVLPTGTNAVGLSIINNADGSGAQTVCVASEAMPAAGLVQCLDVPALPLPMTSASVIPSVAFKVYAAVLDGPQQVAVSSAGELFISEQRASVVSFVEPAASTSLSPPVAATGRAISPLSRSVVIVDQIIAGSTYPVAHVESAPVKTTPAIGHTRFALSQDVGPAQPVGISTVVTDPVDGRRTVYVAEYFKGITGNLMQGRIARLDVFGSGGQRTLHLSPLSLNRTLVTGTPGQAVETVVVSDDGVPVDWSVEYSGACLLTPGTALPPSQIAFSTFSGATQAPSTQFDITAIHALSTGGDLAVGEYCARVTVSDEGPEAGAADPVSVELRLTVSSAPEIHVSPGALTFTAVTGATHPAAQAVLILNAGGGTLEWTTTLSAEIEGSISIVEQPAGLEVSMKTPLPEKGIDLGSIIICSNAPNAPINLTACPQEGRSHATTVAVEVIVSDLQASPGSLLFTTPQKSSPADQTVTVTSEGAVSFDVTMTTQGGGAWLSVTPISITEAGPATLTVSIESDSLPVGQYTGRIMLTPADGAAQVVPVTLHVLDTIAPQLMLPADITVRATAATATVTFTATATDVVDGNVHVTCTPPSGGQFPLGTTTVACAARDAAGNTANGTFRVTVEDGTAPTLNLPADITVPASGTTTTVTYAATATDLVNGSVAVTCTPASGAAFALGRTTVACEATDAAGNTARGSFVVTVSDRTGPTITAMPSPITAEATGAAGAVVTFSLPTATDLVDGALPVSCSPAPGVTFPLGQHVVTCSATDTAGNAAAGSFAVTVQDTTAPTIAGSADIFVTAAGRSGTVVNYALPLASDIVHGAVQVVCTPASGSLFAVGRNTVACTATDAAGNVGTGTFTITVTDSTPPVLAVPADVTVEASVPAGAPYVFVVTAIDAIDDEPSVVCTPASGRTFALGATKVGCTATDTAGNSSTDIFVVTVVDTTAPAMSGTPTAISAEATGPAGAVVNFTLPTASDLVNGAVKVSCTPGTGSTFALGAQTVTCTASDGAGNVSGPTTFTVTVQDTTAPILDSLPNLAAAATSSSGAVVTYTPPAATDVVTAFPVVSCAPASGSTFAVGSTTVVCTATDGAGNASKNTFTVTVAPAPPTTVEGRMSGTGHFRASENTVYFQFHIREKKDRLGEWGWIHLDVKEGRDRDGFATTRLTSVVFSNDPAFQSGRSPRPAIDTVVVKGEGRWNGRPGYTFEMRATDQGEPRKDTFQITIRNSSGRAVATFGPATLAGGNIQSHRLQYWWSGHAWQKGDDTDDADRHQGGYEFGHDREHQSDDRDNDRRWGSRDDDDNDQRGGRRDDDKDRGRERR